MWLQHPPELPKNEPATPTQQYGFSITDFLDENKYYLIAILLILIIFFASRFYYNRYK